MEIKTESPKLALSKKITTKKAIIGVIGLGYVGLPLALEITNKDFRVIGFDKDYRKIDKLKAGQSYIVDLPSSVIHKAVSEDGFVPTNDFSKLSHADVIVICVPTPTTADGAPNISYIEEATIAIQQNLSSNTLIILESTTYPGTTEQIVQPILEKSNFVIGQDIFLAYSPERVDPGNVNFSVSNTPKVVGGITEACLEVSKLFYETALNTNVFSVTSPKIAEMEKLLENTFRQINIALVNELSRICHKMDIDVWEVIEAASTKPYGFMPFTPGPGVGGHCIPVDPKYLSWASQQHGIPATLIEAADKINDSMPSFVVDRLNNYLVAQNKKLNEAEIVVIGVAYKPNINDFRESPALQVIGELKRAQCKLKIVDPFIESFTIKEEVFNTVLLTETLIQKADAILILTNHKNIDYTLIDQQAALIFDTRNTHFLFKNQEYYKL
ncbi:nucleotide sugar dehydrogenase [Lysinibacillus pakistanensis]|uniref:Nucleotide sugar dehydrogenase n=1 Tax=Lysinibacillus pakistanensis TaxID=759811 RepID=A0AAX3WSB5_9BACI|nr:nucleotide sugar dehydrogenase [Lysinibacillus pakistanensis]MDM5230130.1 nucleotide sugar dehydrogenase [Lysinibacillus pakistanensis]WHY45727.1 nucleotide sugar dehydrogenase [Lysinibacillus pakistanensis]WHY50735.1 nucleotide sugar dehydrogenase [Lysinibacillus pakistanensis]